MSAGDQERLLLEFKAYHTRPTALRNPVELLHLLRRIFPLAPIPGSKASDTFNPLVSVHPDLNVSWVTQDYSMARRRRGGNNLTGGHPVAPPSSALTENLATNTNTTHYVAPQAQAGYNQPPVNQALSSHTTHQFSQAPPSVNQVPPSQPGPLVTQPADQIPFSDSGAGRPTLPPLRTIVTGLDRIPAVQPQGQYYAPGPRVAAHPSGQYPSTPSKTVPTPSDIAFAPPSGTILYSGYTPLATTYGQVPPPGSIPNPGPPLSHIWTGSIASAMSRSSSAYSNQAPFSEGAGSDGSSAHVTTPGNSSTGPNRGVEPASLANPSATLQPRPPQSTATRGRKARPKPLRPAPLASVAPPPPPAPTPLALAHAPDSAASAPPAAYHHGPTTNSDALEQSGHEGGATRLVSRLSGNPYPTPQERESTVAPSQWQLFEDGWIVHAIAINPGSAQRLEEVLRPVIPGSKHWDKRVLKEIAADPRYFNGTRTPKVIYDHILKVQEHFKNLVTYKDSYPIDFSGANYRHVEPTLQTIQRNLARLNAEGANLCICAWRLYQYIIQSWYHNLRVTKLATNPRLQLCTSRRSGDISPVSAPSVLPSQPSMLLAPAPSNPSIHAPTPTQAPSQAMGPPRVPDQVQDAVASPGPGPRTPSISSLRVPRDSSTGRLTRRNASLVYPRSTAGSGPTGQTPPQSESSSATGLSLVTNSPAEVPGPSGAELVRQGQRYIELREREVESTINANKTAVQQNALANQYAMGLMQQSHELTQQEATMRMQFSRQHLEIDRQSLEVEESQLEVERQRVAVERQRMNLEAFALQLELERLALQSVASQLESGVVPQQTRGVTIGPQANRSIQHTSYSAVQPFVPTFNNLLDQTRAYHAHQLGLPALAPQLDSTDTNPAPMYHMPQAGLSNHPGRLRGLTPPHRSASSNRFEDVGTVRGSPRAEAASDDLMEDVTGMEIEDGSQIE